MPVFTVEWRMDIAADNAEEAAREALRVHRDRSSTANHFYVYDELGECEEVDLQEIDEDKASAAVVS